jgi:hypothetical protein
MRDQGQSLFKLQFTSSSAKPIIFIYRIFHLIAYNKIGHKKTNHSSNHRTHFPHHADPITFYLCFQYEEIKVFLFHFYFLFTIVMNVLISCTENPKFFIEVLDELELFINKKVIFDEKKISVGAPAPSAVCRLQQIL